VAISIVSVYTRTTDATGKRRYEQADHRQCYPAGTIFCLRYGGGRATQVGNPYRHGITLKYALARAKMREADLLTGAINAAKNAPVVPIPAQPEKPVRLTIDQAIDRYLRNASTKSPRTLHGYTYTLKQFRVRVSCSAFVFEQSQAQPCLCSWSVRIGA
jgi:hypothetical protein